MGEVRVGLADLVVLENGNREQRFEE